MASTGAGRTGFSDVDASGRPEQLIDYLDAARRQPVVAASKEWSVAQLQLESGQRALDVGCGTGEDVVSMAALVGPTGQAIGLDSSHAMISEASRRHRDVPQASFRVGDAERLPFAGRSLDGCRAERTLQHLSDPKAAVAEMARVVREGGRAALVEPDWETLVIEGADAAVSAVIWAHHITRHPHPRIGRRLWALLTTQGFTDVSVSAGVVVHTEFAHSQRAFGLTAAAVGASGAGLLSGDEAGRWLADLEASSASGQFFCALTSFWVAGTKGSA